jgi:hypothetical protein
MNLLGAALYDPTGGAAVSKVTTSLIAMTALDTTNLRVAFTVPSHGMVTVKMSGVHHGSTTVAQVLLGVLEGATLRGRMVANKDLLQTAIATSRLRFDVEYTITGLTPGAVNWDAAYGVEIVSSAGGAIKYGGPNNTTTDDAHGAFRFEVWDPRPIPTATPGAANGLQICGPNAATTYATLTSTGAFSVNGVNAVSQTGDTFARQGAPAGASVSADVAAVKAETALIQAKTTNLPAAPASTTNITAASGIALAASQHVIVDSGTVTTLTNLPPITAGWLTATGIAAAALNGKGDWNIGKTGYTLTQTFPTNFAAMALTAGGAVTAGTVSDKTGYALTSGERTSIANEVEAQIIDDTDSEKVLTAITDKIASVNPSLGALTLSAIGSQVRTELTPELARIDVATSSRLATAGYTAPPSAATNATAVRTELATELGRIDVAASTRLASASYTAPPSAAANATAVRTELAVELARIDAATSSRLAATGYTVPDNTSIAAIKVKTDQLAFTAAGKVDANVKAVNSVAVRGSGATGDEWGP